MAKLLVKICCNYWIVIGIFIITFIGALTDYHPQNEVRLVWGNVTLNCPFEKNETVDLVIVRWYEYLNESYEDGRLISEDDVIDHPNQDRYNITGSYDLTITDLQLEDGGKYACKVGPVEAIGRIYEVDLIVLESNPICSTVNGTIENVAHENETVMYSCNVTYQGRWPPHMIWFDQDGNNLNSTDESEPANGLEKHTLTITATDCKDQALYHCIMEFSLEDQPSYNFTQAKEPPAYKHKETTEPLTVIYGPRKSRFSPLVDELNQLSPLYCISHSNPPPQRFIFKDNSTGKILQNGATHEFVIPYDLSGDVKITCEIFTDYDGEQVGTDVISHEFNIIGDGTPPGEPVDGRIIALSVLLTITTIAAVALGILLLVVWKRKSFSNDEGDTSSCSSRSVQGYDNECLTSEHDVNIELEDKDNSSDATARRNDYAPGPGAQSISMSPENEGIFEEAYENVDSEDGQEKQFGKDSDSDHVYLPMTKSISDSEEVYDIPSNHPTVETIVPPPKEQREKQKKGKKGANPDYYNLKGRKTKEPEQPITSSGRAGSRKTSIPNEDPPPIPNGSFEDDRQIYENTD